MIPINLLTSLYKPGRYGQWIVTIVMLLCAVSCGLAFGWGSSALPKMREGEAGQGLILDLIMESIIVTAIFYGNLTGPIPSGYLMHRIGRRNSLCIAVWLHVAAWLIMWTTASPGWLIASRVLSGLWAGLVYTIVPVYIGECVHPKIRGKAGAMFGVGLFAGSLSINLLGNFFNYFLIAEICCFFTVILAACLCLIPESPYFHVSMGRLDHARDSLAWLRGWADSTVLDSMKEAVLNERSSKNKVTVKSLFKNRANRRALMIVEGQGMVQRLSGLTILFAFTSIIVPESFLTPKQSAVLLNIVWIVTTLFAGVLIDRFGRRLMMTISCTGTTIAMSALSIWFYLRDNAAVDVSGTELLPLIILLIHALFYSVGIVSVPLILQGEMFPPNIKSIASTITSIFVALVSGFTTNIFLPLEAAAGIYSNFVIAACGSLIGVFISVFLMIETKGRSLEEIQTILSEEKKRHRSKSLETTKF